MIADALNQNKVKIISNDLEPLINEGIELEEWLNHPYTKKIREIFKTELEKQKIKMLKGECQNYEDYLSSQKSIKHLEFLEKYIEKILNQKNSALEQKNRSL